MQRPNYLWANFTAVIFFLCCFYSFLPVSDAQGFWTSWSTCSKSCGIGISKKYRLCQPYHTCPPNARKTMNRICINKSCQNFCGRWSKCSAACGFGIRTRIVCQTGLFETSRCFSACQSICENSILSAYRSPSSACCDKNEKPPRGECGVSRGQSLDFSDQDPKKIQKIWPWTAVVKIGANTCLGAIISDKFVITSAKCVVYKHPYTISVICGPTKSHYFDRDLKYDRDIQIRAVKRIVIHPQFDTLNYAGNNIALLEIRTPIKFISDFIAPICLPHGETVPYGSTCVTFDYTSYNDIKVPKDVRLLPTEECIGALGSYKIGLKKASSQIDEEKVLCGEQLMIKHYSCQGTPGSALMCQRCSSCRWMLYGVTSYGDKRCTMITRPGVFAKISYFEPWILEQTGLVRQNHTFASCSN